MICIKMTNHNINSKTKREIRKKKGDICEDCGKPNGETINPDNRLQIHHKIPRWKGGTNLIYNLRLLCKDCHDGAHSNYNKIKLKQITKSYEKLVRSGEYEC